MKSHFLITQIVLLICYVKAYEDKAGISKRINFYQLIKEFSGNKIAPEMDSIKGLFCKAIDHLYPGETVLKVPKKYGLCPYFLYPFKFEIIKFLSTINGLNDSIGKEQKYGVFVLVYELLYHMYANKEYVMKYIDEQDIKQYKGIDFPIIENI
jgi:hypothetical protein